MLKIYFIIGIIVALINCIMYTIGEIMVKDDDSTWHEIKNNINVLRDPVSPSSLKKMARGNIVFNVGILLFVMFIGVPLLWPIVIILNAILSIRLCIKKD